MSSKRPSVRPGFLVVGSVALLLLWVIAHLVPGLEHNRKGKLPRMLHNLRQLDLAKTIWASDQGLSNGAPVYETNLHGYLVAPPGSTGLVQSVDGEIYLLNAVGTPCEARLTRPLGDRYPEGTIVRMEDSTNRGWEMVLPGQPPKALGSD